MAERLPCVVPGCRRATRNPEHPEDIEYICATHWALLPPVQRRRYRSRRRQWRRLHDQLLDSGRLTGEPSADFRRLGRVTARLWRWLRSRAIERAVGL